jgi:uncharacterized protein YwqG
MSDKNEMKRLLEASGRMAVWDKLEPLIRPAILLTATKSASPAEVPHAASRLGGHPDMPKGTEWPTRDDVPMEFVAQLRLADLAKHDVEGLLPKKGHLLFFYNTQWGVSDVDEDAKYECAKVLHFDVEDAALVRTAPPRVEIDHEYMGQTVAPRVYDGATLAFSTFPCLPAGVSAFLKNEPESVRDEWQDFRSEYRQQLAPYKDLESGWYRDNRVLGYLADHDYVGAMEPGEVLLLQVDSDDQAGFAWGDCDKLFFVASKADVEAKDFSRVRLHSGLG